MDLSFQENCKEKPIDTSKLEPALFWKDIEFKRDLAKLSLLHGSCYFTEVIQKQRELMEQLWNIPPEIQHTLIQQLFRMTPASSHKILGDILFPYEITCAFGPSATLLVNPSVVSRLMVSASCGNALACTLLAELPISVVFSDSMSEELSEQVQQFAEESKQSAVSAFEDILISAGSDQLISRIQNEWQTEENSFKKDYYAWCLFQLTGTNTYSNEKSTHPLGRLEFVVSTTAPEQLEEKLTAIENLNHPAVYLALANATGNLEWEFKAAETYLPWNYASLCMTEPQSSFVKQCISAAEMHGVHIVQRDGAWDIDTGNLIKNIESWLNILKHET